jgi:sortase A
MSNESSPYLVRGDVVPGPGTHSHNRVRRIPPPPVRRSNLLGLRIVLLVLGVLATGYYGYSLANERVYQAYENWSFDQQIAGRSRVSFADYLREQTPFGFVVGQKEASSAEKVAQESPKSQPAIAPPHGSILGRVEISRLNISAMVREGVDAATLSRAVGHIPSTALAGQSGNFAIAAHRDTLFRALKNIQIGDEVEFQSPAGKYAYRVIGTQIVRPSDVSVLRADGGPKLVQEVASRPSRLLTMITCYPFNYIGSAPQRFIVQAAEVDQPPAPVHVNAAKIARPLAVPRAIRHSARISVASQRGISRTAQMPAPRIEAQRKPKKPGFWHRLFRVT